jgi:flagellar basal body-associated protein FliL
MFRQGIGQLATMVIIVLVVVVLVLVGAMYGIFTHRGSGIDQHPRGGDHVDSPGVGEGTSRMSSHTEENESAFDSHGTK